MLDMIKTAYHSCDSGVSRIWTLLTDPNGVTKLTTARLQAVTSWNAGAIDRAAHSAGVKSAAA